MAGGAVDKAQLCVTEVISSHSRRRVGIDLRSTNPDEGWMLQAARNLNDAEEGFLRGK